ncbi:MAG: hypothetical protein WBA92_00750 [Pseudorhodobacter sp.]
MIKLKPIATALALTLSAAIISAPAVSAEESSEHFTNYDNLAWEQVAEGAEAAILWGSEEDNDAVWAFRMQPGVAFPLHAHTHDYNGLAIQGNWVHIDAEGNEVATARNSFAFIKGGEFHGDRCEGPEVCITLVDLDGPRDLYFPE